MDAVAGIVRRHRRCRRALERIRRRWARGNKLRVGLLRCAHSRRVHHTVSLPRRISPDDLAGERDRLLLECTRFRLFDGQRGIRRRHGGRTHGVNRKPSLVPPRRVDVAGDQVGADRGGEPVRCGCGRVSGQPTALPRLQRPQRSRLFHGGSRNGIGCGRRSGCGTSPAGIAHCRVAVAAQARVVSFSDPTATLARCRLIGPGTAFGSTGLAAPQE